MVNLKSVRRCICPYCFERIDLAKAFYRCTGDDDTTCPEAADPVMGTKWSDHAPRKPIVEPRSMLPNVIEPTFFDRMVRGGRLHSPSCRACGARTTIRLCPECHQQLPTSYGREKHFLFATIGAKSSGKSHYIASVIRALTNRVGNEMGFSIVAADDGTIARYNKGFHDPLFVRGTLLDETRSRATQRDVGMPLVYSATRLQRRPGGPNAATLVFYDAAGEDLMDAKLISRFSRYVYNADGIVLLLDGEDFMSSNVGKNEQALNVASNILTRAVSLYDERHRIRPGRKLPVSLAITLSKIDLLRKDPMLASNPIWDTPNYGGGFDGNSFYPISNALESIIRRRSAVIPDLARARFGDDNVGYFGISALGETMGGSRRSASAIEPIRVADPIVWLMHRHGLITSRTP